MKKNSKIIVLAIVILAALLVTIILLFNRSKNSNIKYDFYISKYAPQSVAYFDCKTNGMVDGGICAICEQHYIDAYNNTAELNLSTDELVLNYVKSQSLDCVNSQQGGN